MLDSSAAASVPGQRGIYEIEDEQLARWLAAAPRLIDGAAPDDVDPA